MPLISAVIIFVVVASGQNPFDGKEDLADSSHPRFMCDLFVVEFCGGDSVIYATLEFEA
ncbi:hypothetical protein Plhal304r1_c040g0118051 [Plasmopara halstedii]